jgi:hypothetical protein
MRRLIILATAALVLAAATASAGLPPIGPRIGYTSWEGLKQVHFGAHAKLGDLFPNIALTPNIELGLGDNLTVFAINGDLAYRVTEMASGSWEPYVGGSLSLLVVDSKFGSADTDLGLSAVVGTTHGLSSGNELLFEIRLGILDSPGFKATAGFTFF